MAYIKSEQVDFFTEGIGEQPNYKNMKSTVMHGLKTESAALNGSLGMG